MANSMDLGDLGDLDNLETPTKSNSSSRGRQKRTQRLSRAADTWDNYDIHKEAEKPWQHAASLDAPPPRPGFVQRWIRIAIYGVEDETNGMRRLREGWKPRPKDSIPASFPLPTIQHGEWAGCIGVEGMILCEMPEEIARKAKDAVRRKTDRVTDSIESELQAQSDPRMAITQDRKTASKLVATPKVAPDE